MPKIPELAAWVDSHDTAPFFDDLDDAQETFVVTKTQFVTKPLDIRLRTDLFAALEVVAERRGIPYQMLIQTWLREKLLQEAPDLVPQPT